MPPRKPKEKKPGDFTAAALLEKASWSPFPDFVFLAGESRFLRKIIERRLLDELFGDNPIPAVSRFDGRDAPADLLARVLDDLRTVSLLSTERAVVVESADSFLTENRDDLEPFVEDGFSGGHLILHLDKPPAENTRISKAVRAHGWVVTCSQPWDRPPPWETTTPPWNNDLSRWIVAWAVAKGLEIDLQTAYQLQERVGTDLGDLDENLEKLRTYLGSKKKVDGAAITAVVGELREDSLFDIADAFIRCRRADAVAMCERVMRTGYHPQKGPVVYDASSITIMFIGALVARLKPLRKAHAMQAIGKGPAQWIAERVVTKPFIDRFRGDVEAMPPDRLRRTIDALAELDRGVKSGADPQLGLTILLARC